MHGQGVCPTSEGGGTGVTNDKTHGLASLLLASTEVSYREANSPLAFHLA